MRERPILFSGPMVKALLSGTKTQTRRIVQQSITGPNPPHDIYDWHHPKTGAWIGAHGGLRLRGGGPLRFVQSSAAGLCPYGVPGDRLWVRETWALADGRYSPLAAILYRADGDSQPVLDDRWKPSIHMPRWASRITLEVTDVRVERLQDISEKDALAEGVDPCECPSGPATPDARSAFAELWDRINGKRAPWASSPWVWVVSFRKVD